MALGQEYLFRYATPVALLIRKEGGGIGPLIKLKTRHPLKEAFFAGVESGTASVAFGTGDRVATSSPLSGNGQCWEQLMSTVLARR